MGEALAAVHKGFHGRVLFVDLTAKTHEVQTIDATVYRDYLGGYGLGAWLMWKHFPAGTDALAPEACFAMCSGLLTGLHTPFSGRIQIVGKSPLTDTWADSNSRRQRVHSPARGRLRRARRARPRRASRRCS